MASAYLSSLMSAFGGTPEGPDPSRLEGLGEYLQQHLADRPPELDDHVGRMRSRIQEAWRDREGHLNSKRDSLNPALVELIQSHLSACEHIDQSLADMGQAEDALSRYQQAVRAFFETSQAITALANSSQPICTRCASQGDEPQCPSCQAERLIPDPDAVEEEFLQAEVNDEYAGVFRAYSAVISGRGSLADLVQGLQALELTLLEAQALAEQGLDEHPDDPRREELLQWVHLSLDGLEQMHGVEQSRSTRELHQGWANLLRGAERMQQLPNDLAQPEEED